MLRQEILELVERQFLFFLLLQPYNCVSKNNFHKLVVLKTKKCLLDITGKNRQEGRNKSNILITDQPEKGFHKTKKPTRK